MKILVKSNRLYFRHRGYYGMFPCFRYTSCINGEVKGELNLYAVNFTQHTGTIFKYPEREKFFEDDTV